MFKYTDLRCIRRKLQIQRQGNLCLKEIHWTQIILKNVTAGIAQPRLAVAVCTFLNWTTTKLSEEELPREWPASRDVANLCHVILFRLSSGQN